MFPLVPFLKSNLIVRVNYNNLVYILILLVIKIYDFSKMSLVKYEITNVLKSISI